MSTVSFPESCLAEAGTARDIIICGGCKSNIQLDDSMNTVRKAHHSIRGAMNDLRETVSRISGLASATNAAGTGCHTSSVRL